jgi:thymidylate synthase (FAD)
MIKAELISHMGTDLTVVDSARVSFNKQSDWQTEILPDGSAASVLSSGDAKLINYLAKHKHFTPFTHPQITLRETVPIFVARQRFKHVVGFTYNEVSRRYVDDTPEFHIPKEWRGRPAGSVKQGSAGLHPESAMFSQVYSEFLRNARATYENMIACGIAPEQARMVLPQSMLTSYYVTGSLAAHARAYTQRVDSHAQAEIQELGHQWGKLLAPLYPVSWAALTRGEY